MRKSRKNCVIVQTDRQLRAMTPIYLFTYLLELFSIECIDSYRFIRTCCASTGNTSLLEEPFSLALKVDGDDHRGCRCTRQGRKQCQANTSCAIMTPWRGKENLNQDNGFIVGSLESMRGNNGVA